MRESDTEKAKTIKAKFDKAILKYPCKATIESEKEMLDGRYKGFWENGAKQVCFVYDNTTKKQPVLMVGCFVVKVYYFKSLIST